MTSASAAQDAIHLTSPRLEVLDVDEHRVVLLNGYRIGVYARVDSLSERVIVTQLVECSGLQAQLVAESFGHHPVTVSRWRSVARTEGSCGLVAEKKGPKRSSKRDPGLDKKILQKRQQGLSYRAIAERLSKPGKKISHMLVAAVVREHEASQAPVLPGIMETPVAANPAMEEPTESALVPVVVATQSRYAGAMLLYAALSQLDLWGALESLAPCVGPARAFGWRQCVAAIIFCFALRLRSLEDLKNAQTRDLGALIDQATGPGVQTLRRKVARLGESIDALGLARELMRRYLALEPVWEGLYYVDGHFVPYHGMHQTPKGWDSKRRLAVPGHTDVYVHDGRGRALFFLSQPLNDSLARAIPRMVEQIRAVHGQGPFTLVFDRGGYSGELFRWLSDQGVGFITYLKGRAARRRFPVARFARGWFAVDGKRMVYRLYEKRTRIRKSGLVRTVVYRTDDGKQIPVITNLNASVRAAKVVHCLRLRWSQENGLKYLVENYGIDQLIEYGADEETQQRQVANPRRKQLNQKIAEKRNKVQALEAELGRILEAGEDDVRLQAATKVRGRLDKVRQSLSRLQSRRSKTPTKIPASQAGPEAQRLILREHRRLVVNTLKLAAYNAERLLALQFDQHYQQRKDVFSIFRSLLHLPGTLRRTSSRDLEVVLDCPSPAKVAGALDALLSKINQQNPRLFGNGPVLHFRLEN